MKPYVHANKPLTFLRRLAVAFMATVAAFLSSTVQAADATPQKPAAAKPQEKEFAMHDGEYTLTVTHSADHPDVQFPRSPIADAAYKPKKSEAVLRLRFSDRGRKVTLVGDGVAGTLEKKTDTERVYDLDGAHLFAGGQLHLKQTAGGIAGTYTVFGSGVPVLSSVRGSVTPDKTHPAPRK